MPESVPEPASPPEGRSVASTQRRALRWLGKNGWLVLAAGAVLVLARVVEFSAPAEVRVDDHGVEFLGEAPSQDFAPRLDNPQAVQLRATLRLYPRADTEVGEVGSPADESARVLSQPVVTTIYGLGATIDQTVRLDGGDLQLDLELSGTPRLAGGPSKRALPPIELEQELKITSRRERTFGEDERRVHLLARGSLTELDHQPYRWVFLVEDNLFALDLELFRGG
ncbi:hypothetical protein ACNOYE_15505 [Nannocystaceae bacterium ST9]